VLNKSNEKTSQYTQPQQMQVSQLTNDTIPSLMTHQGMTTSTTPMHATNSIIQNNNKEKYTAMYNDQAIIGQRLNRPKLKLDDFSISRTLGTGSFGRVHLIQSKVNARYYAMKVLKKSEVIRLKQVEHTNNEKHILESVAHPFLVNLWGTFQDDANLYMVMDYVPGGELFSVLRRSQVNASFGLFSHGYRHQLSLLAVS
jgi:protein kinase A